MKLEYPRGRPNFFETYIKNPDFNFKLTFSPERENWSVWESEVREGQFTLEFISPQN